MKIAFFGTPYFSLASFLALIESEFKVIALVTQPDRPAGRGQKLTSPPLKETALNHGIPVFQPERINVSHRPIADLKPDVIVTVAYGQILSREVLDIPKIGCVNVHASLLPELRGASPINWAIIRGDTRSGITTMLMDEEMDTGNILLRREVEILPEDDAGALHDKLMGAGADLLLKTLRAMREGALTPIPQDDSLATFAPAISRDTGRIDWNKPTREIVNLIRGCAPWPTAWTYHGNNLLKIWKAAPYSHRQLAEMWPGTVVTVGGEGIAVVTADGAVLLTELQREGKKRLDAAEFLRGYCVEIGQEFSPAAGK